MNDDDQNPENNTPDEAGKTGSLFSGFSFIREIKLAVLAGVVFGAVQWGGELLNRLERWIDGDPSSSTAATALELPAQASGTASVRPAAQANVLEVAGFRINTDESWTINPISGPSGEYKYLTHLLDPSTGLNGNTGRDRAFLTGLPESYLIELPENEGQIILLRQHVLINKLLESQDAIDLLAVEGADGVVTIRPSGKIGNDGARAPLTFDKETPVIFDGVVDSSLISENDLFDHYLMELISTFHTTRGSRGPVELRHLRRRLIDSYEIGEIDYVFDEGKRRLSAVFYWHQVDDAQWGEFGLFLTMHKEPVSNQHQEMYELVSSLRIMNGDNEVWRGFQYDAPADNAFDAFVHVEIDRSRLLMSGVDVRQVEAKLAEQRFVSRNEIEEMAIAKHGDSVLYLKDIAKTESYAIEDIDTSRTALSVLLTVTQ